MRKHHKYFICSLLIILILVVGAVTFFYERNQPQHSKLQNLPTLMIGDWVVRLGTINDSRWISNLGKSEYSHIGMIVQLHPKILVVHATTDDGESASNQVIVSELERFLSPELAQKGAIIRPMFLNQKQKQQIAAFVLNQRGKSFILSSKDEPHLYCTTLLSDSIVQFHPSFKPKWNYISAPFFKGEYLFPQAFVDYPDVKMIYQVDY
ncbi:YiiX/YebB-like N1pC/P60 family cysteine hydrolase [Snodgrassella alvi]|uniref:Uncharacterized protein n=1 Tax=Snodgrassella alvi TaxID=1196083 RepID=A0A2N9WVE2_9NEIS|nr:YiiX/YebB-like N1pC/P60 family cysteine hydrolase [Snodgrassella alvi]PIT16927.1 hypothetical protein BGI32_03715 [Snodgrassella alvi]PIT22028.1 hypothetical protein BGI34_00495 [Snodgrassella alvi]